MNLTYVHIEIYRNLASAWTNLKLLKLEHVLVFTAVQAMYKAHFKYSAQVYVTCMIWPLG